MKNIFAAFGLTAVVALSGCVTATPYQAQVKGAFVNTGGYSDLKISSDRFRVSFDGNSVTDRETVERYLLYRAAEVALREGADWFMLATRNTDTDTRHYASSESRFGWAPQWEYFGRGRWALVPGYDPFWNADYNFSESTRYRANAEILLGKGKKPVNDPSAFDAHEVQANLAPTIKLPAPKA